MKFAKLKKTIRKDFGQGHSAIFAEGTTFEVRERTGDAVVIETPSGGVMVPYRDTEWISEGEYLKGFNAEEKEAYYAEKR